MKLSLLLGGCFIFCFNTLLPQDLTDVTEQGISDGVRNSKQQDRDEAIMDAKIKAIEKAGVNIQSETTIENFQLKKDWIESKAQAYIMPGFQIIDVGYGDDGLYHVVLVGKVKHFIYGGSESSEENNLTIEDYNNAIKLNPTDENAFYNSGTWYSDIGDSHAAIVDYSRAIKLNPNRFEFYFNRGFVYLNLLNNNRAAVQDFTKTIELNPRFAKAYYGRGLAYDGLENYDSAIRDLSTYLRINGNKDGDFDQVSNFINTIIKLKNGFNAIPE